MFSLVIKYIVHRIFIAEKSSMIFIHDLALVIR